MKISVGAGPDTPRRAMSLVERRVTVGTVTGLLILTSLAWYLTARQALQMSGMVTGLGQVGTRMPNEMSAPLFMAMWLTMMVAMMFPTIAPMVLAHRMVLRKRGEGYLPTMGFIGGYLLVWTLIGVVPLALFLAFRSLSVEVGDSLWLRLLSGAVFVIAGVYQFTPWKQTCLKACRTPLNFVMTHDFGAGAPGALRAGMSHGAFCLGCCWALMAVLVVVGLMNLVWMAVLALIFLAEKNWRYGPVLNRVVGPAMVVLGIAVILIPELLPWISGAQHSPATGGNM